MNKNMLSLSLGEYSALHAAGVFAAVAAVELVAFRGKSMEEAAALAKEADTRRCLPLKVSGPFHTPLMAPAGAALAERFRTVTFAQPAIPVVFNCLGNVKPEDATIPELLVRQVQSSVYMEDSTRAMAGLGIDTNLKGTFLCMKAVSRQMVK